MNQFVFKSALVLMVGASVFASKSYAHHGVNGQFDESTTIKVEGIVTKSRLVNPHAYIYFNVLDKAGQTNEWRCELGTGSALKRAGWTSGTFAKGTQIKVVGSPARSEDNACYVHTITFDSGVTVDRDSVFDKAGQLVKQPRQTTLVDGTPNIGGTWVAERPEHDRKPPKGVNGDRPPMPPEGMPELAEGEHRPPRGDHPPMDEGRPQFKLTEEGKAAVADYAFAKSPRMHCEATNIIDDWTFDQLVNKIEQTQDDIVISYGFMDIARTIHLDLDKHPENIEASRAGHSIGHWDGKVLVVDTVGFNPGYLHAPPMKQGAAMNSNQLHMVERFYLSEDGLTLYREYEGEDALYLENSFSGKDEVKLTEGHYEPYNCADLTNEVR
ncbi:hypothetical protein EBI01_01690 [Marinomonas rhizomae]|uniref:Uncharacterized protein n=1 Tax=Marinomonas rhizomae TaxID=491948 RepID=A0A366JFT6_9GAMM|nr:DUF6152 family protein [Marinomonas rhizomae]RBP85813.1 hypothetical protein DFP80_101308 [Marinomonas rhizomae]RNF75570.1 hypothetical protein EBI01_01690 [Marinomonas rhizomae]